MVTLEQLENILKNKEHALLEFKTAKNNFDSKNRSDYCAAIANAGGGYLILGVNDDGKIVGTDVYKGNIDKLPHELHQKLNIWIEISEILHSKGRVIVFKIPSRPVAQRVKSDGHYGYPVRKGESLVEMDDETTRLILNETQPDFTSEIVSGVSINDLSSEAIKTFKSKWSDKSGKKEYLNLSNEQVLKACSLSNEKGLTRAALILFGSEESLSNHLACAEIIFEWRQIKKTSHDFRKEWRKAFFLIFDDIWKTVSERNIRFPFQEGFVQREVLAFNEKVIREAILNAVCHRDYHITGGSTFIKASPGGFSIVSPGGFAAGITPDNALLKQYARNRLLAEAFQRVGLVERAGQGLDDIFRYSIEEGKGLPDFKGTDSFQVVLNIPASLQDADFIKFLEIIINAKQTYLSFDEILMLEKIRSKGSVRECPFKDRFLSLGIIEKIGQGRGATYILSRQYYKHKNKPGIHTKLQGLTRDQKKQLILNHLKKEKKGYSQDIQDALEMKQKDVSNLLQELRTEKKVKHIGERRWGHWELY